MSNQIKPIKVWGKSGPNPPKVLMVLEELGLPYEVTPLNPTPADVKSPEFLAINPNGRIPAIYDPNTDLTLWESGAIILYLVERYDKEHKLSFAPGTNEAELAKQWVFFQVSGQGPYYGQYAWFKRYHSIPVPSATERYAGEAKRVSGVLEGHLEKQKAAGGDGPWLVGGRISYADIAWIPWQMGFGGIAERTDFDPNEFPVVKSWLSKMIARPAVTKVLDNDERMGPMAAEYK